MSQRTSFRRFTGLLVGSLTAFLVLSGPTLQPAFATHPDFWNSWTWTPDGVNMPVYRAQVSLTTAGVPDAGTNDWVYVQLNDRNITYLDSPANDFEPGLTRVCVRQCGAFDGPSVYGYRLVDSTRTYDLLLDHVQVLGDIDRLRIGMQGSDGWAIKKLELYINGRKIYETPFGPPHHWLDDWGYHTIGWSSLYGHTLWTHYTAPPPPQVISGSELESRMETMFGHNNRGTRLFWGDSGAVEVSRGVQCQRVRVYDWTDRRYEWRYECTPDSSTVHVDVDLRYEVDDYFDQNVNVDFDLRFSCSGNTISITVTEPTVSVEMDAVSKFVIEQVIGFGTSGAGVAAPLLTYILKQIVIGHLEDQMGEFIEDRMTWTDEATVSAGVSSCSNISVSTDGSVYLQ